jgi:hypothetical protein
MKKLITCLGIVGMFGAYVLGAELVTAKALNGSWCKSTAEHEIEFTFKDSTLVITLKRGEDKLVVDCDVAVGREGRVFGTVVQVKEGGIQGGGDKGDLFGFKFQIKGDSIQVNDLRGTNVNEGARNLVEGEFKKKW